MCPVEHKSSPDRIHGHTYLLYYQYQPACFGAPATEAHHAGTITILPNQWLRQLPGARRHRKRELPDLRWPVSRQLNTKLDMAAELTAAGRVVSLLTTGRITGRPASATVGFVQAADGTLVVAASTDEAQWARNLAADPHVIASWSDRSEEFCAEPLSGERYAEAIRDLILRYGTPSERLGRGPAFRLRPCPDADQPAARAGRRADTVVGSTD